MSGKIKAIVANIKNKLENEASEDLLVSYLTKQLEDLKLEFKIDKNQFDGEDLECLEHFGNLLDGLDDFKAIEKEISAIPKTREAYADLWLELNDLAEIFCGTLFEKKLRTTQRKINQYKSFAPVSKSKNNFPTKKLSYTDIAEKLKELNKSKDKCPNHNKCGGYLKAKTGVLGVFWGCSSYPRCEYSEDLTDEQNDYLLND